MFQGGRCQKLRHIYVLKNYMHINGPMNNIWSLDIIIIHTKALFFSILMMQNYCRNWRRKQIFFYTMCKKKLESYKSLVICILLQTIIKIPFITFSIYRWGFGRYVSLTSKQTVEQMQTKCQKPMFVKNDEIDINISRRR